jgi:hypothetical protein
MRSDRPAPDPSIRGWLRIESADSHPSGGVTSNGNRSSVSGRGALISRPFRGVGSLRKPRRSIRTIHLEECHRGVTTKLHTPRWAIPAMAHTRRVRPGPRALPAVVAVKSAPRGTVPRRRRAPRPDRHRAFRVGRPVWRARRPRPSGPPPQRLPACGGPTRSRGAPPQSGAGGRAPPRLWRIAASPGSPCSPPTSFPVGHRNTPRVWLFAALPVRADTHIVMG